MRAVFANLVSASLKDRLSASVTIKYLLFLGGLLFLVWPISDVLGRDSAPQAFPAMAYAQGLAVPFLVNSFITGRFELTNRIETEDWISFTNVSTLSISAAHTLWAIGLAGILLLAGLPLTLVTLPLAGGTWLGLLYLYASIIAISGMAGAFAYVVLVIVPAGWVTSAAVDACLGLFVLLSLEGYQDIIQSGGISFLPYVASFLSPVKAVGFAIAVPHGIPWAIASPGIAMGLLTFIGGIAGFLVRGQGRESASV